MPFYAGLGQDRGHGRPQADHRRAQAPAARAGRRHSGAHRHHTLLLATWNIREFDSGKYGYRDDEAYYYIAEILSRFDLIAIQEVRSGLLAPAAATDPG